MFFLITTQLLLAIVSNESVLPGPGIEHRITIPPKLQAPDEGRRTQWPKPFDNVSKDKDIIPNVNNVNNNSFSQKFRHFKISDDFFFNAECL